MSLCVLEDILPRHQIKNIRFSRKQFLLKVVPIQKGKITLWEYFFEHESLFHLKSKKLIWSKVETLQG
jgi:hypothetical protein